MSMKEINNNNNINYNNFIEEKKEEIRQLDALIEDAKTEREIKKLEIQLEELEEKNTVEEDKLFNCYLKSDYNLRYGYNYEQDELDFIDLENPDDYFHVNKNNLEEFNAFLERQTKK